MHSGMQNQVLDKSTARTNDLREFRTTTVTQARASSVQVGDNQADLTTCEQRDNQGGAFGDGYTIALEKTTGRLDME